MSTILTYHREGDYLIPDQVPPETPRIGVWGRRRRDYLRKHKDPIYTGLLLSGKLKNHLEKIDRSASEMLDLLIEQMAEKEGITEQLKAKSQMDWVAEMNRIQTQAFEIIYRDLIYN